MTVMLLTEQHLEFLSSTGGYTGLSESTLVEMPHCWKSYVAAQMFLPGHMINRGFLWNMAFQFQISTIWCFSYKINALDNHHIQG